MGLKKVIFEENLIKNFTFVYAKKLIIYSYNYVTNIKNKRNIKKKFFDT